MTRVEELLESVPKLSVGILTADLLRLGEELAQVAAAGVTLIHVDVIDGVFAPTLTFGAPVVRSIPDSFVKDVHLMVEEPLSKVDAFIEAGAGVITFHVESTRHPHRVLQYLDGADVIRGVAVNPGTPIGVVEPLLDELELLLILGINPGWSGQVLAAGTARKFDAARELIAVREVLLGVDGGVTRMNVAKIASLQPDIVVAGSAIYDGGSPGDNARALLEQLSSNSTG
jgi:ribulose-phosphate 3-epimerase